MSLHSLGGFFSKTVWLYLATARIAGLRIVFIANGVHFLATAPVLCSSACQ